MEVSDQLHALADLSPPQVRNQMHLLNRWLGESHRQFGQHGVQKDLWLLQGIEPQPSTL